jgi:branched-chain amino acid transport system ATP-binding protein
MPILEVQNLASGYGEVQILWGASLQLKEGNLTSLVGANGAGKTTLLRSLMGQIRPWGGRVLFEGDDVTRLSPHSKVDRGLVLVPEGRQLFTNMTVRENLEMGATPQRARDRLGQNLERVFALFPRLRERGGQNAGTLSGGEQQMLAVARGLMSDPRVLMIDELSLGLAPLLVAQLFSALRGLRELNITILLVEQNVHMALSDSDYGYVLSEGKVSLEGPAADLARNEHVRAAYLGI